MLTTIGICLIVLVFAIFMVSKCYVGTPAGQITIIRDFGGKAVNFLTPGIGWMLWPYHSILCRVKIRKQTRNIIVEANCLLEKLKEDNDKDKDKANQNEPEATIAKDSIISVRSPEVSFNFTLNPQKDPASLDDFFKVVPINEKKAAATDEKKAATTAKKDELDLDYDILVEKISDAIRVSIMESLEKIGFMEAALSHKAMATAATEEVKLLIKNEKLPIDPNSVSVLINKPFWPADPDLAVAFEKKPLEALKLTAAQQDMERQVFEAKRRVEIAHHDAAAKAEQIKGIMAAFGDEISETERRNMYLALQQLETLRDMKDSTVILPGTLLDAVNGLIGRFGGRR